MFINGYEIKTYNRMPLNSFSEIDECIGKDYNGDLLVRYDASQWINLNKLVDLIESTQGHQNHDVEWIKANSEALLQRVITLEDQNKDLLDTIYQLEQRLDVLESTSGEN